jgi:hypothetical protein
MPSSNSHFDLSARVGRESHFESAAHKIEEVGPTRKADIARERAKIIDERFPTYPCLPHTTVWGIQQVQKSVQEKRQNIESRQPRGQRLAAMPKVMVQMRAFRFQRSIVLVLHFPPRAPRCHNTSHVFLCDFLLSYKSILIEPAAVLGSDRQAHQSKQDREGRGGLYLYLCLAMLDYRFRGNDG